MLLIRLVIILEMIPIGQMLNSKPRDIRKTHGMLKVPSVRYGSFAGSSKAHFFCQFNLVSSRKFDS